mgnify:CR=1 FL=1
MEPRIFRNGTAAMKKPRRIAPPGLFLVSRPSGLEGAQDAGDGRNAQVGAGPVAGLQTAAEAVAQADRSEELTSELQSP